MAEAKAGGRPALVLFSGGLDSTTVLAMARASGYDTHALIFRYGQRHAVEVAKAEAYLQVAGIPFDFQDIDLRAAGGSALTSDDIEVPRDRSSGDISDGGVPVTYVPARNTVFLSLALAWAEVREIDDIFLGINALDYSGYPDCRPEYLAAFESMANLASKRTTQDGHRLRMHAPLVDLTKAQIIERGVELGVDYSRTWSCYQPMEVPTGDPRQQQTAATNFLACGSCDSCQLRRKGFQEAGVDDPTLYI
ncbi:MAG: 7-cyano-7-deazaguanine synthase QueC [Planctomycetota bacterium]